MRKFLLCFFLLSLMGVDCSHIAVQPDAEASALSGLDETGLIDGCGTQLQDGFMVCRMMEGPVDQKSIFFVGPPAQCAETDAQGNPVDSCVHFSIYFPNGNPSLDGKIPRGQTRVPVLWKDLVKKDTFAKGDRGFWSYDYTIKWIDPDGKEQSTFVQGELILRVYTQDYKPLHDSPADPNFVWQWTENGAPVAMTTGGRVYVGKKP